MIEECLNPPVVWEASKGWYTTQPFSDPETFEFPEGIGAVECVNVEHEEVTMLPRSIKAKRVTFKFGLGDFFINALKFLHSSGLDRTQPVAVRSASGGIVHVSPRDVLSAVLPQPAELGTMMTGKTCAGVLVTGRDKATGARRCVYLYHVADNAASMRDWDCQCVVWQTAFNPVIALELLATRAWAGAGVMGPEAFAAHAFLTLMRDGWGAAPAQVFVLHVYVSRDHCAQVWHLVDAAGARPCQSAVVPQAFKDVKRAVRVRV